MVIAQICDILHRYLPNTQLFNASSSEIYKGHVKFHVDNKTIHNTYHTHPYSIAKIMGASMVDFYRETYGARFSNGILFTTESSTKSREFLLNKVAHYCSRMPETPLVLGSLNSWRNIIHPKDVARAILAILDAPTADNYIISNDEYQTFAVLDIVLDIFRRMKKLLTSTDGNKYYDETGVCRLIIETKEGFEEQPIKITGSNEKLRALGWTPEYSVADILDEICKCAPNT
jgi:GDP-D-mannose dehydratase